MWVEKSPDESQKELKRRALGEAGAVSLVVFMAFGLATKIGYSKWRYSLAPITWNELLSLLPLLLGISLAIFIGAYYILRANSRRTRSRTFVCLGCGRDCDTTAACLCTICGGLCVDLNHAKWVPEDEKGKSRS